MDIKDAKAALNGEIEKVVRTEFADAQVHAVFVEEGTDFDGDEILRVMVIFVTAGKLDAHKAAGLARHLRPVLEATRTNAFPVISFRSKADHDRLSAAA